MMKTKVIDSHIHISSQKNQHYLKFKEGHPLYKQNRLEEYFNENKDDRLEIDGLVAIEFDPAVDIDEFEYFARIIRRELSLGEGTNDYSDKLKAIIPQAPIPKGSEFLQEYVSRLKQNNQDIFKYVKGFRYLVQDKPKGTMTQDLFVDSLKWLDQNGFVFDWGIDLRNGGFWQFDETIKVFEQVPNLTYIINHLTKPSYNDNDLKRWAMYMHKIYELTPNSFMKLSGGFSELPNEILGDLPLCADRIFPWFKVCFDLWGVDRLLWASNWPVCAMFVGSNLVSKWFDITEILFDRLGLSNDDKEKIYWKNCVRAYNML